VSALQTIGSTFWRWLDDTADIVVAATSRVAVPKTVRLVEGDSGSFAVQSADISKPAEPGGPSLQIQDGAIVGGSHAAAAAALRGSRVEVVLRPERFLFRPLELPTRATEFLGGVVRSQIDRLTPWKAEQAAFGFTKPSDAGGGRIAVTVAATAKALVMPYVRAVAALGARSVVIATRWPDAPAGSVAIPVLEDSTAAVDARRVRRALVTVLAAALLIAATAVVAATAIGGSLRNRQDELARRIAERRAAMIAARNAGTDPAKELERALAMRKNETPSAVIVLEVLSQILPDHTYVTELRIEGDRLRLTGVTRDAPSLIRLIEQSRHFTRATFYAPTTRSPNDSGDRFHIEAHIAPVFSIRS